MTATAQWELGLPIHHWLDHWLAQDIATTQRPCAAREGTPIRPRAHAAGGGGGNPRSDFPCTGDPFLTESPLRRSLPPTWRSSGAHMAIGHLNRRRHQTAPPRKCDKCGADSHGLRLCPGCRARHQRGDSGALPHRHRRRRRGFPWFIQDAAVGTSSIRQADWSEWRTV